MKYYQSIMLQQKKIARSLVNKKIICFILGFAKILAEQDVSLDRCTIFLPTRFENRESILN